MIKLVGSWQGPAGTLVLAPDGSFALMSGGQGERGSWQLRGDRLVLTGSMVMAFRVQKIEQTLWLDNTPFQPLEEPEEAVSEERWVPAKLAGTWGYFGQGAVHGGGYQVSRVLELRADGTYTFATDNYNSGAYGIASGAGHEQGNWWVEGSLLWFEGNAGRGSRRLDLRNAKNGDPMIVLDGQCYVTKFKRASW